VIGPADPLVLDSSALVAYERMKTPGAGVLHEVQWRIVQWAGGRSPVAGACAVPGRGLTRACGKPPELDFSFQEIPA